MKNMSSNTSMEKHFILLSRVKKVAVNEMLYEQLLEKINEQKINIVSLLWVRYAAAVLIVLLSTDIYLISQKNAKKNADNISVVVPVQNNMLYHE